MKPLSALLGVVAGAMVTTLGMSSAAFAVDFSLRGTFTQDDDVQLFDFTVGTESTITLRTYSYAGGIQADDTVVAAGGFDPVLSLFNGDGTLIALGDDDTSGTAREDPTTGQVFDSLLEVILAAGNYTVALTQYDNFTNTTNLADGFRQAGNGNFTSTFARCTTHRAFCDFTGDIRTNEWAFDVLGVLPLLEPDEEDELPIIEPPEDNEPPVIEPSIIEPDDEPTSVPEPTTTVALTLAGLGALVKLRRQK